MHPVVTLTQLQALKYEELQQMAYDMVGKPEGIEVSQDPKDVVAIIEYRDGSIIDVVRKPLL